jgi:hypothetical protein
MADPGTSDWLPGLVTLTVWVVMAAPTNQVKLAEPAKPEPSVAVTLTV